MSREDSMTEKARVIIIDNEKVYLACVDEESCSACAGKHFCNVNGKTFTALNSRNFNLHLGDDVEVFLPPGKTIFSGFMVMIFPLLLFIAGFLLTRSINPNASEGIQALGGFLGLAAGFFVGYVFGKSQKKHSYPEITAVLKRQ